MLTMDQGEDLETTSQKHKLKFCMIDNKRKPDSVQSSAQNAAVCVLECVKLVH